MEEGNQIWDWFVGGQGLVQFPILKLTLSSHHTPIEPLKGVKGRKRVTADGVPIPRKKKKAVPAPEEEGVACQTKGHGVQGNIS